MTVLVIFADAVFSVYVGYFFEVIFSVYLFRVRKATFLGLSHAYANGFRFYAGHAF